VNEIITWERRCSFNVQKVLWTLDELDLPYEHRNAGGSFGSLDTPEFLAMNPHRKVPVIQGGSVVVSNSKMKLFWGYYRTPANCRKAQEIENVRVACLKCYRALNEHFEDIDS
jgi:Glutathione S-transferase, N-terminal domain